MEAGVLSTKLSVNCLKTLMATAQVVCSRMRITSQRIFAANEICVFCRVCLVFFGVRMHIAFMFHVHGPSEKKMGREWGGWQLTIFRALTKSWHFATRFGSTDYV